MKSTDRPNILLITVHDLGIRLGCYGFSSVPSPNLDRLAEEGIRFTQNFSTAPYCSPSRGSIITGQYPHVNGLMGLVNLGWDWPKENYTLARALAGSGYETFLFGLQHEVRDEAVQDLGLQNVSDRSIWRHSEQVVPLVEKFLEDRKGEIGDPFYARIGFSEVHRPFERYEPEDSSQVDIPFTIKDTPGARKDFAQ